MATEPTSREPRTYRLKVPIAVGTEEVVELTFRRPKGKEMRSVPAGDPNGYTFGVWLDFAAVLADVPTSTIDLLEAEDVLEVVGIAASFFAGGRATSVSVSAS